MFAETVYENITYDKRKKYDTFVGGFVSIAWVIAVSLFSYFNLAYMFRRQENVLMQSVFFRDL